MGRILLVEDSATQALKVEYALRGGGHVVITAKDGEEGRDMFLAQKPDLVLMDIVLPKKDGLSLCKEIKAHPTQSFTPVILLTNQGDIASKVKGFEMGADDYLTKPFDNEELLARVKSMLRIKELQDNLHRLVNHLELISTIDELTQVANRRRFNEILRMEYERSRRYKHDVCLIMIDIDRFKRVNDTHGHPFGDVVLKEVAARIRSTIRRVDYAARYGGEEFTVLCPSTTAENGAVLAEKLRAAVESSRIERDGDLVPVTISLGVASGFESGAKSPEELVALADEALYESKKNGRNRVSIHRIPADDKKPV